MSSASITRERSLRSVFVGNIPYEATEEKLKDIFASAGPVVSFRLVYDRESGKPKGYGFCEYQDKETALSAMRNLSGYELNGRSLRVDSAASEKDKDIPMQMTSGGGPAMTEASLYGDVIPPEEVPEVIRKAVQSLPPEQMFELMVQMKEAIYKYPDETRRMLLQNPQLAYALLQALVVMKVVDPADATKMLHPPSNLTKPLGGPVPVMPMEPQVGARQSIDVPFIHAINELQPRPTQVPNGILPSTGKKVPAGRSSSNQPSTSPPSGAQISAQDQEKAALIMQVLSLTDQQISLLPPEQRQSILILREQISRSKMP